VKLSFNCQSLGVVWWLIALMKEQAQQTISTDQQSSADQQKTQNKQHNAWLHVKQEYRDRTNSNRNSSMP
jgi:hypothetical protein